MGILVRRIVLDPRVPTQIGVFDMPLWIELDAAGDAALLGIRNASAALQHFYCCVLIREQRQPFDKLSHSHRFLLPSRDGEQFIQAEAASRLA